MYSGTCSPTSPASADDHEGAADGDRRPTRRRGTGNPQPSCSPSPTRASRALPTSATDLEYRRRDLLDYRHPVLGGRRLAPYPITCAGGVDDNYSFTYVPAQLTITRAPLTVTAADKTKEYGNLNPLLTFAYSGFQGTDTATDLETAPTCSTTATQFSGVAGSPYPITCAGGVDDNYSFTYVPAQLTITKAPLTVTAADKTKEYGNLNPLLTFAYSGFQGTDTATDLETAPTCSTTATQFSGVAGSPYPITCAGGVDDNYSFTYVPAQLDDHEGAADGDRGRQDEGVRQPQPAAHLRLLGLPGHRHRHRPGRRRPARRPPPSSRGSPARPTR